MNLLFLMPTYQHNKHTLAKPGERSMDLVALSMWLSWSVLIADCYGVCTLVYSAHAVCLGSADCVDAAAPVLHAFNGGEA